MGKNYFSEEQVQELRKNPYVKRVSEKAITYTEEFKIQMLNDFEAGITPAESFRDMGFDTKVLGQCRITQTGRRVRNQAKRNEGIKDLRKGNSGRSKKKEMTPEDYTKHLEHENKLLKQQVHALKKMKQLEREALWKHSRLLKKNSN